MTTLIARDEDTAFVLDGFDLAPSQVTGADHAVGLLWQQTFNGTWPLPDRRPNHAIAQLYCAHMSSNGQQPRPRTGPDHPLARLWNRVS